MLNSQINLRKCANCGQDLTGRRSNTKFCDGKCRTAFSRSNQIPRAMTQQSRWVNWAQNKMPLNPATGKPASSTNPKTWASHNQAKTVSTRIGYMLGDGIGCIDLDHCITGNGLTPVAEKLLALNPRAWVEISPSGTGLHICGLLPEQPGKRFQIGGQNIEVYSRARYITITGKPYCKGALYPLQLLHTA